MSDHPIDIVPGRFGSAGAYIVRMNWNIRGRRWSWDDAHDLAWALATDIRPPLLYEVGASVGKAMRRG